MTVKDLLTILNDDATITFTNDYGYLGETTPKLLKADTAYYNLVINTEVIQICWSTLFDSLMVEIDTGD